MTFRYAWKRSIPVMAGYIVLGMGFGMLLAAKGYGVTWAIAMSVFIYAGSMQYVAIDLITGGVSLISAALMTLMVNARHLFYGLSMLDKYHLSIMDVTPDLTSGAYARPLEVRAWLLEQGNLERFVILDDETFWAWNWLGDYLVCTTHMGDNGKYVYGMTDEDAEKAIAILNRPQAEKL